MSPHTAWMTMAESAARGSGASRSATATSTTRTRSAAVTPVIWCAPGPARRGCLRERAGDAEAARDARGDVRGPGGEQLLVGVDRVALPGGEQAGGAQPLGEPDEGDGEAAEGDRGRSSTGMPGRPRGGSPWGTEPDGDDALGGEVEHAGGDDGADEDQRPHGTRGARRAPPKRIDERDDADDRGGGVDLGDRRHDRPGPVLYRADRRGHPQEAGDLPDDDQDHQAEDEAGDDGSGHELRGPAQPRQAPDEEADAGTDGQSGCECHRPGGIALRQVGDQRAGEHRHRGDGAHDEVGRRAEHAYAISASGMAYRPMMTGTPAMPA